MHINEPLIVLLLLFEENIQTYVSTTVRDSIWDKITVKKLLQYFLLLSGASTESVSFSRKPIRQGRNF